MITGTWDKPVFLIGGGPSLKGFKFSRLRGKGVVVAINDAMKSIPWADCVFTIDTLWLRRRRELLRQFTGEKIAAVPPEYRDVPDFKYADRVNAVRVSRDSHTIHTGENSGFAAMNLAIVKKGNPIYLLGYDLGEPGHWHDGYEFKTRFDHTRYSQWVLNFESVADEIKRSGISVKNCMLIQISDVFPLWT